MRESWVDYAKGIGIILVVFGHVNRGLYSAGIHVSEATYQQLDSIIYSFHMPLFFFLSGLFFTSSLAHRGKRKFIINKIDTIVYPYIIWSLLQGTIEVFLSRYTNNPASFSDIFSLFAHPRAQFWFLYALFMVFVVAALLYHKQHFSLILPILLLISIGLYLYQNAIGHVFHIDYITRFMVFFLLGALAIRYSSLIASLTFPATALLAILFVIAEWVFHSYLHLNYTQVGFLSLLLAVVAIAFITSLSVQLSHLNWRWLQRLGELSMVIYLMHILAGSGLRIILSKGLHIDSWLIQAVAGTLFGLVAPIVAYSIIQRLNLNFLLERPRTRSSSRTAPRH